MKRKFTLLWQSYEPVRGEGRTLEDVPTQEIHRRFSTKYGYPPRKIKVYAGSCILAGPLREEESMDTFFPAEIEEAVQGVLL